VLFDEQTRCKVKRIRADNGKEYINNDLDSWFKEQGIVSQTTAPTPQNKMELKGINSGHKKMGIFQGTSMGDTNLQDGYPLYVHDTVIAHCIPYTTTALSPVMGDSL
jgi:hypothetical protein